MLHGRRVEPAADLIDQRLAPSPVITQDPDLDQFMACEIGVYFLQDSRRQTGLPDHDDRLQMMGAGFETPALDGGKINHS